MIAAPVNDRECLSQLTAVAQQGSDSAEIRAIASRFSSTKALVRWIRSLPQRDDDGRDDDGPRVTCDVGQRARLVADDPNCVERSILYLAAAEVLDPGPKRQLATVDITETLRHTFPLEDGDPVVLDPRVRRNALRAGIWRLRNAGGEDQLAAGPLEVGPLVEWLLGLADASAEEAAEPERSVERVARAREVLARLFDGAWVRPQDRADVLFALRLAAEPAAAFGRAGREGYCLVRDVLARALAMHTRAVATPRNLTAERAIYWGGKAVATAYGVGGLYDIAYDEVRVRTAKTNRSGPGTVAPESKAVAQPLAPVPLVRTETQRAPAMVLGALAELESKKGSESR